MRSLLGWGTLVGILLTAAFLVAPILVRPLVGEAVRAVSPFGGAPLQVDAEVSALALLQGRIDSIHVMGSDLTAGSVAIHGLDVTATDVAVGDHSFSSMTGQLASVSIAREGAARLEAERVQLSGSSQSVEATGTIGRDDALAMVRAALESAGMPAGDIALIDGGVRLTLLGQPTNVGLGVVDGAVTIAGAVAGGSIVVLAPEPGDRWQFTDVTASPEGVEVRALVDLGSLLRPG
jgi:hypothetical protein